MKTQSPVAGSQLSSVQMSLSLHVLVLSFSHWPVSGLQLSSVEPHPGRLVLSFRYRETAYRSEVNLAGTFQAWNALCALGLVLATGARIFGAHGREPHFTRPAALVLTLVVLQIALGATIIWTQKAVTPTTSHVAVGAAILATSLVIALRSTRAPRVEDAWQTLPADERATA